MDVFRTVVPPVTLGIDLNHQHSSLCLGSCFAEHIGARLAACKFPTLLNPFGIVYNPVSISQSLERLLEDKPFSEKDLFEHQGIWHSYAHHSRFSDPNRSLALEKMNASFIEARPFLLNADRLILTFGTAHVYIEKTTNKVVANCHKVPQQAFLRRRLSVDEVVTSLKEVLPALKKANPALEIIATVSPVRHLRDGLIENQRSKGTLMLGLDALCQSFPFVHYFPAYELVMDDLRDYRFYDRDLAHPNDLAVDYVWKYFENTFFKEDTLALCNLIQRIHTSAMHRPFHPTSAAHQNFLKKELDRLSQIEVSYPMLDFQSERNKFESQLID